MPPSCEKLEFVVFVRWTRVRRADGGWPFRQWAGLVLLDRFSGLYQRNGHRCLYDLALRLHARGDGEPLGPLEWIGDGDPLQIDW